MESVLYDAAGHRRSPVTMPGYHQGRPPRNRFWVALRGEADRQIGHRLRSLREGRVCGVVSCTRARTDGRGPGEPEPLSF
jgi:hypothetical protein